jgi:hypothetical protein
MQHKPDIKYRFGWTGVLHRSPTGATWCDRVGTGIGKQQAKYACNLRMSLSDQFEALGDVTLTKTGRIEADFAG